MTTLFPDDARAVYGVKRKVPKVVVPLARMVEYWGAPCPDFEPDCICCKAWNLFDGVNFVDEVDGINFSEEA